MCIVYIHSDAIVPHTGNDDSHRLTKNSAVGLNGVENRQIFLAFDRTTSTMLVRIHSFATDAYGITQSGSSTIYSFEFWFRCKPYFYFFFLVRSHFLPLPNIDTYYSVRHHLDSFASTCAIFTHKRVHINEIIL